MDNNSASNEFKQLFARGKEQGYLTFEDIYDVMPLDISSDEQFTDVIQFCNAVGIKVYRTPPEADELLLSGTDQTDAEEAEVVATQLDIGRTTDPVRMYMREMGNVSLLTRKDEIEISKRIERGTNDVQACLVEFPQAMEKLFELYDLSLDPDSDVKIGEIISGFIDPAGEEDLSAEASNSDEVDGPADEDLNAEVDEDGEALDDLDEDLEGDEPPAEVKSGKAKKDKQKKDKKPKASKGKAAKVDEAETETETEAEAAADDDLDAEEYAARDEEAAT